MTECSYQLSRWPISIYLAAPKDDDPKVTVRVNGITFYCVKRSTTLQALAEMWESRNRLPAETCARFLSVGTGDMPRSVDRAAFGATSVADLFDDEMRKVNLLAYAAGGQLAQGRIMRLIRPPV